MCICVSSPRVFAAGFATGWVDFRVHVLLDVSMCVRLCADVSMPDLRLELCVVEPSRVLVLDNWVVCKCVFLSHACR